jgi:hypothetical protein
MKPLKPPAWPMTIGSFEVAAPPPPLLVELVLSLLPHPAPTPIAAIAAITIQTFLT